MQRTEEDRCRHIEDDDRVEPHLSIPQHSLQRLSMVNAGPLYCTPDRRIILDAVRKYQTRGIRYIRDSAMMWMNIDGLPPALQSFAEVFRQFGILDLQWILGGMPCGLESAFCRPRVEVIEEESYETCRKGRSEVTTEDTCEFDGRTW